MSSPGEQKSESRNWQVGCPARDPKIPQHLAGPQDALTTTRQYDLSLGVVARHLDLAFAALRARRARDGPDDLRDFLVRVARVDDEG